MRKIPLLLDCACSARGAAALALASAMREFELAGVTVNGGSEAARGVLAQCEALGLDVPVAAGTAGSMLSQSFAALEDIPKQTAKGRLSDLPAWRLIAEQARLHTGLVVVGCGPLTNMAAALYQQPDLPRLIARLIVGGGMVLDGGGALAAEGNLTADPEAAQHVLTRGGLQIELCPADRAFALNLSAEEIPAGGRAADIIRSALAAGPQAMTGALALLWAADGAGFTDDECYLGVETKGLITRGKLVTDCYSDRQMDSHNGRLVLEIERDAVVERLARALTS